MSHLFSKFEEFDYKAIRYNFKCESCIYNTPAIAICSYEHTKYKHVVTWLGADGKQHTQALPGRELIDLKKCPCPTIKDKAA